MEMIETEHFNPTGVEMSEEGLINAAKHSFLDTINQLDNDGDLFEFVQTRIIKDD